MGYLIATNALNVLYACDKSYYGNIVMSVIKEIASWLVIGGAHVCRSLEFSEKIYNFVGCKFTY